MRPKYTKVNRNIPYNKATTQKVENLINIKGMNNINNSVSSNRDITKPEMDELSAYIINKETTKKIKKVENIDHIENINSVPLLDTVNSEKEDLPSLVIKQETIGETREIEIIDHTNNLEDSVIIANDSINPEISNLSAYMIQEATDILNKIEDSQFDNIGDSEDVYVEIINPEVEDIFSNNMAQESNNDMCEIVNAMSYENSVSPPKNNPMRGVDFNMAECTNLLETDNCNECCSIFSNDTLRAAFGYQIEEATCVCHDICVQDVRDICVEMREFRQTVPCNINGGSGCRGGFSPNVIPTVDSFRIDCAEECLNPPTCDRITNEVNFQVILDYNGTKAIMTFNDTFDCLWFEFARFPSGVFYTNDDAGLADFQEELTLIDGTCKIIIFERVEVVQINGTCELQIDYKVINKLWKNENLLVSAIKPYGEDNLTVKREFAQGHNIGPCPNGSCNGA